MPPGFLCPDAQDNTLSSAVVFEGTRGSPLRTLSALYDIGHRYGAPIWGPHNSGQGEEGRSVTFPAEMVAETRGCWKSKPREPAGVKCCRRAQPPWGRVPEAPPLVPASEKVCCLRPGVTISATALVSDSAQPSPTTATMPRGSRSVSARPARCERDRGPVGRGLGKRGYSPKDVIV